MSMLTFNLGEQFGNTVFGHAFSLLLCMPSVSNVKLVANDFERQLYQAPWTYEFYGKLAQSMGNSSQDLIFLVLTYLEVV